MHGVIPQAAPVFGIANAGERLAIVLDGAAPLRLAQAQGVGVGDLRGAAEPVGVRLRDEGVDQGYSPWSTRSPVATSMSRPIT